MNMRTGAYEYNIEMVNGMDMTGYLAREFSSKGIHDDLKIKCVAFDDGSTQFILVVCDLLGLDADFTRDCINETAKRLSIPAGNIVVASIHTHSGPACIFLQDCGSTDESWQERLKFNIVDCASRAYADRSPSTFAYKSCECDIGINRVVQDKMLEKSFVDQGVGILEIRDAVSGSVKILLVNYACHPVVLTHENLLYSKDYPNFMIQALHEKEEFKDAIVIFANGCCGDINPSERGGFSIAERLGRMLGERVSDHSSVQIDEYGFSNSELKVTTLKVPFQLNKIPYEDDIENSESVKLLTAFKNWKSKMKRMAECKTLVSSIMTDIKIITIGKLTIVTLPFEVFHEIGLEIKKYFGSDRTMVLCYANGDFGYFPSKTLYDKAEYEAGMAYKFYGYPGPLPKNSEDILYDALFNNTTD